MTPNATGWYVTIPRGLSVSLPVSHHIDHVTLYITAVDSDQLFSELEDSTLVAAINDIAVDWWRPGRV